MRSRALGILVTAALVVIAACGGGPSGQQNVSGPPKSGGSMAFGLRSDLSGASLDPIRIFSDSDNSVAYGIYDPLLNRLGNKGELSPWLADSWEPSSDLKTWTFHLHKGITFQDGTPFNAEAVVVNFQRHMDPRNKSLSLGNASLIDTVSATDDSTFVAKLKTPWIDFPQTLTAGYAFIASPAAIKQYGDDYGKHPVGTGPFALKEWVPGDHVTATRNKSYWKQPYPYLDSVTWRFIPDQDSKYAALKAGQIDVLQVATGDQVVKAQKDSQLKVASYAGTGGTFVMFNTQAPPFNDVNARLAVSYATNRQEITHQIGKDKYPPATGIFPPGSDWYSTGITDPNFDLNKAKQSLQALGKPLSFKFNIVTDPITRQYGQVLQAQWQKAGINVELNEMDQPTLIGAALGHQFQAQIFQYGDWFDPDYQFFTTWISPSTKLTVTNYTLYSNPSVDAALVKGRTTSDPSARKQAYAVLQQALAQDQPYVWLHYNTSYMILKSRVQNLPTIYSSVSKPFQMWVSS